MNEIINKLLLTRIDNPDLHNVLVDHLQKNKERIKNLNKQEVQDIFIKTN